MKAFLALPRCHGRYPFHPVQNYNFERNTLQVFSPVQINNTKTSLISIHVNSKMSCTNTVKHTIVPSVAVSEVATKLALRRRSHLFLSSPSPLNNANMTLESDIVADLTAIETDIVDAVLLDEFSLKGLIARLTDLNSRVMSSQALAKGLLGPRTVSLIHSISSKARVVANNMLAIHRTTEDISQRRSAQIADVLSRGVIGGQHRRTQEPATTLESLPPTEAEPSQTSRGERIALS